MSNPIQPLRSWILAVCCILASALPAFSQMESVQAAIAQQDHLGALRILSAVSDEAATPDTYLYRGIAFANLRQYKRALEAFSEGFNRYPTDPRFHSDGVAFYRRTRPSRMGWGPIAARAPDVRPSSDGLANLLDWVAGCVLVYGALFGVGKLLLHETLPGLLLLALSGLAGGVIYRDLSRRGWETVVE